VRRGKIAITVRQMHRLLGLPDDVRIVTLRATHDPDLVHVMVEGASLPAQEVHGTDYACMAYAGDAEAPFLWHPVAELGVTWGAWVPGAGPDDDLPTAPLSRSVITTRLAAVLAEHGSADSALDARLLRALANTVERLVAEGVTDGAPPS
jgi:hypothetical protein